MMNLPISIIMKDTMIIFKIIIIINIRVTLITEELPRAGVRVKGARDLFNSQTWKHPISHRLLQSAAVYIEKQP